MKPPCDIRRTNAAVLGRDRPPGRPPSMPLGVKGNRSLPSVEPQHSDTTNHKPAADERPSFRHPAVQHSSICGFVILALCFAGCTIGPNYQRPALDVPDAFRGAITNQPESLADLPWWNVFQDDTLQALVRTALTNNYDLRAAESRVEQARAIEVQVHSEFFPGAGYQAEATRGRNALTGKATPNEGKTANAFVGILAVAWEPDLWGRVRRLDEAAHARFLASDEARRGLALSLVSAVAQAYFELLDLDNRLAIARRTSTSFAESLRLFNQRLVGGVSSRLETARAEAALAATEALVPELERQITLKENEICILLGHTPGPIVRTATLPGQTIRPDLPAGLPASLLARRPDICAAEQNLRAANAQIGVAVADFLPVLDLTALGGTASPALSSIATGRSRAMAVDATLTGPLFSANRLRGQYEQAKAARAEAELHYRQTALTAFQEVADALSSRTKLEEVRVRQARAVSANEQAVKLSLDRYQAGKANYYEVLEAQQQLFPAENALAETQLNQMLAMVQLYKSLGGGWPLDAAAASPATQP